jgi:hypothetical protein
MVTTFKTETHCRQETIGAALAIVLAADRENRGLTTAEVWRVDVLLTLAETVLGIANIPREPEAFLRYARTPISAVQNTKRNTTR